MARISKLSNPEFAKSVAEAYINGLNRTEMAEMFSVHVDTITLWTQDPRVQAPAAKMAQERVTRITRKIDKEIEARVQDAEDIETEILLKIRKELLGNAIKVDLSNPKDDPNTINDTITALENDPELAAALQQMVKGKPRD